jgi:ketosteroid isomerase-like protein
MRSITDKETVFEFIAAINNHDVDQLTGIMSDDHIFIDGAGEKYAGKPGMKEGWKQYFQMFPDYRIEIIDTTGNEAVIGLFGYAEGTYKNKKDDYNSNFWKNPAAWKATVENGKIKCWQVYCDYTRLQKIIDRNP